MSEGRATMNKKYQWTARRSTNLQKEKQTGGKNKAGEKMENYASFKRI